MFEEIDKDISEGQPISNLVIVEIVSEITGSNSKTDGNVAVDRNHEEIRGDPKES